MKKPYCIGIAGGSASGKSTFSGRLEAKLEDLRIRVFHMDEYFRPEDERPRGIGKITGKSYTDDNHPQTADLARLRADIACAIEARECDVIIVEGLMTLHDEPIRALMDLKLFVECDGEERMARRLRRNMAWGLTFDEVAGVYLDLVRFRHTEYVEPSKWHADLILNGANMPQLAIDMIAAHVRAQVA